MSADQPLFSLDEHSPLERKIAEFRDSLLSGFYKASTFVDWDDVERQIQGLRSGAKALQRLANHGSLDQTALAAAIQEEPLILRVVTFLFGNPGEVGFLDGRHLSFSPPESPRQARAVARLLLDLGLQRVLEPRVSVEAMTRVGIVAAQGRRRRFRRTDDLAATVWALAADAAEAASEQTNRRIGVAPSLRVRDVARRVDMFFEHEGKPFAGLTSVFESLSGGRQQTNLGSMLPALQAQLDAVPAALIVIADGPGLARIPNKVMEVLFDSVASVMTLSQARAGQLSAAVMDAFATSGVRREARAPLTRLIETGLATTDAVKAADLPVSVEAARMALANYVQDQRELGLELSLHGDRVQWLRSQEVLDAQVLLRDYNPEKAAALMCKLMGWQTIPSTRSFDEGLLLLVHPRQEDTILPDAFVVVASTVPPDEELVRKVAHVSLQASPEARLAVLLAPTLPDSTSPSRRALQQFLAANVVAIDTLDLLALAQRARAPRDSFARLLLERSDLTKVSPFVVSSVAPHRVFFGREQEKSDLLGTLATNSVALLGGRRIGKTSLMHHVQGDLEQAGFSIYLGDCQTVRNWQDFARMARSKWRVKVGSGFRPDRLVDIVEQLAARQLKKKLVILLDEVDQLLDWDTKHRSDKVPEAFFRACRAISQEGKAQFVFSGERIVARKLWDPQSPHWNFCRPLLLRQLSRESTRELIRVPFSSMQVVLEHEDAFLDEVWAVTSGHPQIAQFLADRLVRVLNEREPTLRASLSIEDLRETASSFDFREHYLETYWGQSTELEKFLSLLVLEDAHTALGLREKMMQRALDVPEDQITDGLRMLELYGIIDQGPEGYLLRAKWFPFALESYGSLQDLERRYCANLT
jgi:hypothetical protein